jgi:hypothetical protein
MRPLPVAQRCDAECKPLEAAWAYEIALTVQDDVSPDIVFDLVAIYAAANDFGFATAHGLDRSFVDFSYYRAVQLLATAAEQFGPHPDFRTWRLYLDDLLGSSDIDYAEIVSIAAEGGSVFGKILVWLRDQGAYQEEIAKISAWAAVADTQRKRFFLSLLGSSRR